MNPNPPAALPNSFALAVECCRCGFPQGGDPDRLEELAVKTDWSSFLGLVRRHRVEALAWQAVQSLAHSPPAGICDALRTDARRIATHNLRDIAESAALLDLFTAAGIACLFVKGVTLGQLAYGNSSVKMGWDIDLLVAPDAVEAAGRALQSRGYRPVVPGKAEHIVRWHRTRKESVWRKDDGIFVELHSRLADSERLIPGIGVSSPSQNVEVASGIALPTLASDELFAYLCVHGASSAWFRLKWISDLAALLSPCNDAEIEKLYSRSQELGAGRAAGQALVLMARLFGTPAPALAQELDRGMTRWLADCALGQLLASREPTERWLGTGTIHLSQLGLVPGLTFKQTELRRQIRDAAGRF